LGRHVHSSFLPWSVFRLAMPKLILHLKVDLNRIPLTMCAYTNTTMNDRWLCFQSKRLEHLDHDHSETWVGNHCTILVYYSIAFDFYSEEKGRAIKRQHDLISWQSTPISLLAVFHLFFSIYMFVSCNKSTAEINWPSLTYSFWLIWLL